MGLSQLGGTSYNRLITKQNALGPAAVGTASVSADNTWVQVTASLSAETVITRIVGSSGVSRMGNSWNAITVEIGIGGAGTEATIAVAQLEPTGAIGSNGLSISGDMAIPMRIAAGLRVATRIVAGSVVYNSSSVDIAVFGVPWANLEGN